MKRITSRLSRSTPADETKDEKARTNTVELPVLEEILNEAYGFCMEQEITYIHTDIRIQEGGNVDGVADR